MDRRADAGGSARIPGATAEGSWGRDAGDAGAAEGSSGRTPALPGAPSPGRTVPGTSRSQGNDSGTRPGVPGTRSPGHVPRWQGSESVQPPTTSRQISMVFIAASPRPTFF